MTRIITLVFAASMLFSCVSKKKFTGLESQNAEISQMLETTKTKMRDCEEEKTKLSASLSKKDDELMNAKKATSKSEEEIAFLKKSNLHLLERLEDLSIVSKSGAESIRKSLEAMNEKDKYIKDLNTGMQKKDSLNLALVMNLKKSLADINDQDVQVEVRKGVVFISLSDKMLFNSGSAEILKGADSVLSKVARVVNAHKDIDILVEGHTDDDPINTGCIKDNWDLSVKRAASIVRTLQTKHAVAPSRMTAGGRSEYAPKADNNTPAGKKSNRRTEIMIIPKLDQFFELSVPK